MEGPTVRERARSLPACAVAMALGTVVVACVPPPTMERALPVSSHCPEEGLPRARSASDTLRIRWYRALAGSRSGDGLV